MTKARKQPSASGDTVGKDGITTDLALHNPASGGDTPMSTMSTTFMGPRSAYPNNDHQEELVNSYKDMKLNIMSQATNPTLMFPFTKESSSNISSSNRTFGSNTHYPKLDQIPQSSQQSQQKAQQEHSDSSLQLHQLDFIGSSDAVKQLLTLPYTNDSEVAVAVHNMGDGTLLLDGAALVNPPEDTTSYEMFTVDNREVDKNGEKNKKGSGIGSSEKGRNDEHNPNEPINVAQKKETSSRRRSRPWSLFNTNEVNRNSMDQLLPLTKMLQSPQSTDFNFPSQPAEREGGKSTPNTVTNLLLTMLQHEQRLEQVEHQNMTPSLIDKESTNQDITSHHDNSNSLTTTTTITNDITSTVSPADLNSKSFTQSNDRLTNLLPKPEQYTNGSVTYPKAPRQYLKWKLNDHNLLVGSNALILKPQLPPSETSTEKTYVGDDMKGAMTIKLADAIKLRTALKQHEEGEFMLGDSSSVEKNSKAHTTYLDALIAPAPLPALPCKENDDKEIMTDGKDTCNQIQISSNLQKNDTLPHEVDYDNISLQTCVVPPTDLELQLREFGLTSTSHLNKPEHSDPSSVRTSPVCAVLDAYLDNIMANVPELALCLQERGHIQSMKMLRTDDIPILTSHDLDPTGISPVSDKVRDPKTKSLFSPQIVESNASILLQFLKTNCSKENSTYLLRRNAGDTNIQLYDITSLSTKRHCKWNWWLAMMSYRFALRLDQLSNTVISKEDRGTRRKFRSRQRHLFQISYELLEELSDMDGGDHETIRAAVCENLANTFLWDDGEDGDGDDGSNDSPTEKQSQQYTDRNNSIPSISSTKYPSTQPYGNVNVDRLSKAQDHLLRGIQLLKPALESGLIDDSKNDNSSVDPIALQMFGLHHKLTNILLRLVERYFHSYWSSSAMQTLRTTGRTISDASKLLLQLGVVDDDWKFLDDFEQRQGHMSNRSGRDFACSISYQYAWLWQHCGHFARSFAADELWRERGHTCGEDVVCVIKDVEAAASNVSKVISCLISTKRKDVDSLENMEKFHFSSIMMKTKGLLNLNNVSGIISERCDGVSESAINEANSILNKQKQIVRDKRKVLVAAAICYSSAVGIFTHVITGVEVEIVKDGDVPNSVRVHKSQPQSLDSSILSLLRQRLGDSCNEIGKVLLTEVKKLLKVGGDLSSLSPLLLSSESWFIDGLNEFEACSDAQNIALIRCNLCHCCKIRVNLTLPRRPLSGVVNNGTVQDSHAELCLQDAARHLELAHEALDQRDKVNPRTWDMVSDELAATFLILGVRRRQSYLPGSTPVVIQSLRLNPGKERSIVEPIVRAKEIYASLNNNHQAAAADYHLALFYSKVWTCQRDAEKTRDKLSAAFTHFSLAHKYFFTHMLSNEPTFIILCLDLSNLYSAVSGETECLQKALACCLDTCDAFSPRSYKRSKESQSGDEWFGKMKTLASSVEERILKLLQNLVKVEKDASEKKSTTSKTLYRLALTFKMASAQDKHEDAEYFPIYNLLTQIREEHK